MKQDSQRDLTTKPKVSPSDDKKYQAITLPNGLRVLLIENKHSNKAAAALAVNAGHFSDPKSREGLAHFVEHMLFLGTEKYPDGSEYQKFISGHGGHNNAWTATEHTCFFFDIDQEHFTEALDRFSQFFIAPLLSTSFIHSERQNIDAEFKLKLKDEIRRLYDVHKETINPLHPFSQFSVGNIDTLADRPNNPVQVDVARFFKTHYRADYMTLAIESSLPLTEVKTLCEYYFSAIPKAETPKQAIKTPLYLPEHQEIKINVVPVKNDRQLIISFAMPSIDQYYKTKPESLIAYLIGHEGKGSILHYLKKHQWAFSLIAGSGINGTNFKDFNVSISLTEEGEKSLDQVIEVVFSYLHLLKYQPLAKYYFEEKKSLSELAFKFQEKLHPLDSVSHLVINMQHYPVEDYIYGDYVMEAMIDAEIDILLSFVTPSNCRIIHISKEHKTNKESKWYKVPYSVEKINSKYIEHWKQNKIGNMLTLPLPNPYIVNNPKVWPHDKHTAKPEVLTKRDGFTVWYKQDTTFKVPKGYLYIGIDSPLSIANDANIAMTRLFVELYSDAIIEEHYDAELAGIHYHLYAHQGGVTLQVSGVSEKQSDLLEKLLSRLLAPKFNEQQFNLLKKQLLNQWEQADKNKSISQLFSALSSLMQPNNPTSESLVNNLSNVSFESFVLFSSQLFSDISIETLIHGNWLKEHAIDISNIIEKSFKHSTCDKSKVLCPVIDLANHNEYFATIDMPEHDHAAIIYYPMPDKSIKTTALCMLISHLLAPLFFQEMRTEKQFGYVVNVGYVPINRYPGIGFYIQSPHVTPCELISEMNDFIERCTDILKDMPSNEWTAFKQGLTGQLKEKDTSLRIKSQRFWTAICNQDINFEQKNLLINEMLSTKLTDLINFVTTNLQLNNKPHYTDRVTLFSKSADSKTEIHSPNTKFDLANEITDLPLFSQKQLKKY